MLGEKTFCWKKLSLTYVRNALVKLSRLLILGTGCTMGIGIILLFPKREVLLIFTEKVHRVCKFEGSLAFFHSLLQIRQNCNIQELGRRFGGNFGFNIPTN